MKPKWSPAAASGLGLVLASFAVYTVTLIPGVPPTDSGELGLAAWLPGIAHAPGFPLYTVVAWLWTHALPVGRVIWRMNLLSAASAAVAVGLTYVLALRTLRAAGPLRAGGDPLPAGILPPLRQGTAPAAAGDGRGGGSFLPAAVAALSLGLGRTVWSWATVAEVYALSLSLTAAILLLVVRFTGMMPAPHPRIEPLTQRRISARPLPAGRGLRQGNSPSSAGGQRPAAGDGRGGAKDIKAGVAPRPGPSSLLFGAAFLFGLGLGNHLTSIAVLAPAIAFWLTACYGWRFWTSRTALLAALALAAGAAIYLYMPLRSAAGPLLNWGQPDAWQRFWWHVTAKQYRVSLFSAPVGPQVLLAGQLWWTQFTPLGLALLLVGARRTFHAHRRLFWTLLLVIAFATLYAWAYVIEDDGDAYYLPAFLAGAVWVGWGAEEVLGRLTGWLARMVRQRAVAASVAGGQRPDLHWHASARRQRTGRVMGATVAACLLVPALALGMNWRACDRSRDTIPEDYVRDAFGEIGPNGLLLTRDWQFYAPALYLQQVEGLRPDLTTIDTELLRRDWYFGFLHRVAPDLMASVVVEERAFRSLRDAWERGDIPDGDPRISQLQAAYVALLDAFIREASVAGRPVHVGPNRGAAPLRNATLAGRPDLESGAGAGWRWMPVGLSFRATRPDVPAAYLPPLAWQVAAFQQTTPTAPERKVQATRADMATLHGLAQASAGNLAGAEADWRIALAVDPTHGPSNELLVKLKNQR